MVSSSLNTVFLHYLKKYGCTILSYKDRYSFADYQILYKDLKDLCTRTLYVAPAGHLPYDLQVAPSTDSDEFEELLYEKAAALSEKLHANVVPFSYQPALLRNGITTKMPSINFTSVGTDSFVLTVFEADALLFDVERPFVVNHQRRFLVAPSGSGKTEWAEVHNDCVDLDKIFIFPKTKEWWLDEKVAAETNSANQKRLVDWLSADVDGKIGMYADDLGLNADAYVMPPRDVLEYNLAHKGNLLQPGPEALDRIIHSFNPPTTPFNSFAQAISFIRAQGRSRFAKNCRFSWMYCFLVPLVVLPTWKIQTYLSTQTWNVKSVTYVLAKFASYNDVDMERVRSMAMRFLHVRVINHKRVGGMVKFRGKPTYLAVAGHMVNYLILSRFIPLDWVRFFTHIEWNIELFSNKRKLTATESFFAKNDQFAEFTTGQTVHSLWHNIIEWTIGVYAGVMFCRYLGLGYDPILCNSIVERLYQLGNKYPKAYSESHVVTNLRKEEPNFFVGLQGVLGELKEWLPLKSLNL